jgi:hypothetical protein
LKPLIDIVDIESGDSQSGVLGSFSHLSYPSADERGAMLRPNVSLLRKRNPQQRIACLEVPDRESYQQREHARHLDGYPGLRC